MSALLAPPVIPALQRHRRNAGIDALRGLAILLVIVHHLALPFRLPLGPSLLGEWLPQRLIDAVSFNGYEAVFIFFVISGFLIATSIVEHDGALERVKLRRFYAARARRIVPLLLLILALLAGLAAMGVPGFAPDPQAQSIAGLLGSALTFTFNWYEGRTGWAPAAWDVLWSLSIEEAFYLGFPLLCLGLRRGLLAAALIPLVLALVPLRSLVPEANEIWWEKAYLPGMAAVAWGVLAAMLAQWRRPAPHACRALKGLGMACILLVLLWGDLVHRYLPHAGMYLLCAGTCMLLLAWHAQPPAQERAGGVLARMGRLSYELYLCHMFVVLAAEAAYRALLGDSQRWTFAVYLPVLLVCHAFATLLARLTARFAR